MKLRLKKIFTTTLLFSSFFLLTSNKSIAQIKNIDIQVPKKEKYVSDQIIVKFKTDKINLQDYDLLDRTRETIFNLTQNVDVDKYIKENNSVIYKVNNNRNIEETINDIKGNSLIEYVELNYIRTPASLNTNDTYKQNLWGLDNTGQTITIGNGSTSIGISGADIDLINAWNISTGVTDVIVAIIDTGVAYNHPDLINSMWDGINCKDKDGNNLGNCIYGYDYDDFDKNPLPVNSSHGTHIAGTIAAQNNNNKGILGISPNIKIMAIKCSVLSSVCISNGIDFARVNGAKVINASFGGPSYSQLEKDAIDRFASAGGVFVAAAGNSSEDTDIYDSYPSNYNSQNLISVAATNQLDALANFSSYGLETVDVGAPGVNIFSTIADSIDYSFDFENVNVAISIPSTWTTDGLGFWKVFTLTDDTRALFTDSHYSYSNNINSVITSDTINLSGLSNNVLFNFDTYCDTELTDPNGSSSDYISLELSLDGVNFNEIYRWNELELMFEYGANYNSFNNINIPAQYLTSNFKYRFRWVTNSSGNGTNGDGCMIDNIEIMHYSDGTEENYGWKNGTSMATPHVVGLAAYIFSAKPDITSTEVFNTILNTGDAIPALLNKTVTGKRINAFNAINSLNIVINIGPSITGLSDSTTPTKTKNWNWDSENIDDQYRFIVDQNPNSVPTGTFSSTKTTSITSGNGTYYLHVQARNSNQDLGPVKTVSCVLDNTGVTPVIENNTSTSLTLNYNEALYNSLSVLLNENQDISSFFTTTPLDIGLSNVYYNTNKVYITATNSIAGSKIILLNQTNTSFYDQLGNPSSATTIVSDGNIWHINPTNLNIATTFVNDLLNSGIYTTTPSITDGQTSKINTTISTTIQIGNTNTSTVLIPDNTDITELSNSDFNANDIQSSIIDKNNVTNFISDQIPQSVIQWGIPGVTLTFSNPITINIYVGTIYNNQTFNVYRSPSLNNGWTNTGLISSTCLVNNGYCQFTANQASYYTTSFSSITPTPVPTIIPTPTPTSAPVSNNTPVFIQEHFPPQCTDKTPQKTPDLFKIITSKTKAKLIFTPVDEKITSYVIFYGHKVNDERFATTTEIINNNQGEQNVTIGNLNTRQTYYFKIAAINGCTSGPWSEWIPAKANRIQTINKYKKVKKNGIYTLVNKYL